MLEEKQREADKATVTRFNAMVEEFEKTTPDYSDVMDEADNDVSDVMFGAIVSEGPALGYYFAKHPDESAKIARMNERDAVKAIMRIVIKIEDESKSSQDHKKDEPKQQLKKPDPPAQLQGRGAPAPKDRSKMTFKEREREAFKRNPGAFNYEP